MRVPLMTLKLLLGGLMGGTDECLNETYTVTDNVAQTLQVAQTEDEPKIN